RSEGEWICPVPSADNKRAPWCRPESASTWALEGSEYGQENNRSRQALRRHVGATRPPPDQRGDPATTEDGRHAALYQAHGCGRDGKRAGLGNAQVGKDPLDWHS